MYLPGIYQKFMDRFPEVFNDYKQLGISTRDAGPLPEKIQDLVKLGIAIGANSRGAVMSHTRKAITAGATREEVIHAVLLSLTTTGFPNMIAALGWIDEVLEESGKED
jgi:alkylhydroperoxidase/carboxymuconolactone decarboxylase family protein YurZ